MNSTSIVIRDITQLLYMSLGDKWERLLKEAGATPHAITKHIKENPENANHRTLSALANALKMHPYELFTKYRVGAHRITEPEIQAWKDNYTEDTVA